MCLRVDSNKKRASKDLYVFKVLKVKKTWTGLEYNSPYQDFEYKLNKIYKSRLENIYGRVYKGIHSIYTDKSNWFRDISYFDRQNLGVFLCKIPKGSTYYIGTEGDVVSTQIIICEPIFIPKCIQKQNRKGIKTKNSLYKQTYKFIKTLHPNNIITWKQYK